MREELAGCWSTLTGRGTTTSRRRTPREQDHYRRAGDQEADGDSAGRPAKQADQRNRADRRTNIDRRPEWMFVPRSDRLCASLRDARPIADARAPLLIF